MELSPTGCPLEHFQPQQLSRQPEVLVMKGFMTAAECNYISALARPALQPSMVVHPQTGKLVPHPIRSSDGAAFGVYAEDLVVNAINRRIAALTGTATAQGEPLQLLRYRSGNQYRSHLDALPSERNQRVITVLCYLTDDYEGGETVFTRTGLSFRGSAGDALLFHNVTADRRADPLSEHAGLPVVRGEKLVATRWIRERPFLFPPPTPLLQGT
jgi:prolyl 4-hydroxylase